MKVKNIVFSGFAAAILMGTAGANAATPFKIASQAYVDSKVSTGLVDESTGNPISVADALAGKANASAVDTLDEQINGNGTTTSGLAGEVSDLQDALGDGFSDQNTVADAIAGKADADALGAGIGTGAGEKTVAAALADKADATDLTALEGRVSANETIIKSTGETIPSTIGTTQNVTTIIGAINALKTKTDSMATSDTMTQVTTDIQNLQGALGDGIGTGTGEKTVAEALAEKADASTVATDTEVAGLLGDGITTSSTVTQQLAGKQNALSTDQLNSITAAATLLAAGYQTCISQSGGSGHCVLTAASNGLTWTDVTSPFEITE